MTTLYLVSAKNTNSWCAMKEDLWHAFPIDFLMVPSYVITVVADGERLTCGGFSLCKTIHFGNFEFIVNYFGGLSLSPRKGDIGATFMGSTHGRAPTPWWAMIEDSAKEFHMASSGEGSSNLSSQRRRDTGGFACSRHNHTNDGERSDRLGHDDDPPASGDTAAENQPPFHVMSLSSWGAAGPRPCSTPITEQWAAPR
jgi:hypothetical protein